MKNLGQIQDGINLGIYKVVTFTDNEGQAPDEGC